jgi:hypothetical protein
MDIGDFDGVLITQTPTASAAAAAPAAPPAAATGAAVGAAAPGRAGGGGGPFASWNGWAWGISNWNRANVERELRARNLNPVAYNRPGGFESFLVHDPDGFPLPSSPRGQWPLPRHGVQLDDPRRGRRGRDHPLGAPLGFH